MLEQWSLQPKLSQLHKGAMVVCHKLCRTAQSSRVHKPSQCQWWVTHSRRVAFQSTMKTTVFTHSKNSIRMAQKAIAIAGIILTPCTVVVLHLGSMILHFQPEFWHMTIPDVPWCCYVSTVNMDYLRSLFSLNIFSLVQWVQLCCIFHRTDRKTYWSPLTKTSN